MNPPMCQNYIYTYWDQNFEFQYFFFFFGGGGVLSDNEYCGYFERLFLKWTYFGVISKINCFRVLVIFFQLQTIENHKTTKPSTFIIKINALLCFKHLKRSAVAWW